MTDGERTRLAVVRTRLAWARTLMGAIALAIVIAHYAQGAAA